jgi:hypothetical protein
MTNRFGSGSLGYMPGQEPALDEYDFMRETVPTSGSQHTGGRGFTDSNESTGADLPEMEQSRSMAP